MEGQRNFLQVDSRSALDVGYLKEGTRSSVVRRPKFEEGCPEVKKLAPKHRVSMSITLRRTGGDLLWLMLIGMWRSTEALKAETGGNFDEQNKEMSGALGVRKPNECQKAESPLENEVSQGCGRRILRSRIERQHLGNKLNAT